MFERGAEQLIICREAAPDATALTIVGGARERHFGFETRREMVDFQIRFEEHLLRTGWRFVSFSPERRGDVARQAVAVERRRLLAFRQPE